ncbi:anti-phage ZorAB system protein ZorA [Neptunomonas qingdaonensis]|uniref:Methyl-accepting chemotaxis protein n=1 Tax=Neptunomonas qingdaonensis TaxID=1045558 RepID=A0A1I2QRS0_9GAMM|nr:anti-phage ZorAB system protein ZorA [Neptunomonas qingdaonensis]SFG29969.1 hypothetical protein SAMN05216175_10556 [Neptunomonas qingdaonensis]
MEVLISFEGIAVYCAALIFSAFFTYIRFTQRITPLITELKQATLEINKSERDKEAFPARYYEFKEWMEETTYLKDSWREFEETLLLPGSDYDDDKEIILNTRPTGTFFNQRNILRHKVNMRFYNTFPNILTGIGILGTFIGLVVGIYLAAPGLDSEEIKDAKKALSFLLDGASLAFITSICGLGTSLVFSWLEKMRIHDFDKACFILVSGIDARVEYFSAERLANKALQESKRQTYSMEAFADDLAVSMAGVIEKNVSQPMIQAINDLKDSQQATSDETLERLIREFSESISGAAGDEMKAFATTIETMNKALSDQVTSLSEGQQAMQDTSKKAVEEMMTAMADGSSKMKEEVNIAVTDLIAGVKNSVDLVTDKLLSAAEQSATQMEKATANFDSALDKLSTAVNEIGDIEVATQKLLDGLNQALSGTNVAIESVSRIGEHLSATSTKMESTADKILQSTDKVLDASDQVDLIVNNLKSMNSDIKTLWESYHDRFDGVDKSVATLFEKLQEGLANYAQSTNDYVLGLDRHAAKVVQELASATKELTDTVEVIGDSMEEQRALLARKVIMQDKVNEALA